MLRPVGGKCIEVMAGEFIDAFTVGCDDAEFTFWADNLTEDDDEGANQSTPQTQASAP